MTAHLASPVGVVPAVIVPVRLLDPTTNASRSLE